MPPISPDTKATVPPKRQPLSELAMPPEVAREAEAICKRYGYRKGRNRQEVEEELKLQYYYGGQHVAYLVTPAGLVVVAAGNIESEAFRKTLEGLSREEHQKLIIYSPSPWNNEDSWLPTVFADED
jgi:hypothetical protein